jgi:rRNA maturation endonuclease Nob1
MRREQLEEFAKQLSNSDIVVIEATGNAASVAAVIGPHVSRVVIANPKQVRLIAHAKIKPIRSMLVCSRSFTPAAFCRRSGSPTRRRKRYVAR